MKVLISSNNELVSIAEEITGGILSINGISYEVHSEDVDDVPEDFLPGQYLYDNDSFIDNPEYVAPDSIEKLRADIDYIAMETEVIL